MRTKCRAHVRLRAVLMMIMVMSYFAWMGWIMCDFAMRLVLVVVAKKVAVGIIGVWMRAGMFIEGEVGFW